MLGLISVEILAKLKSDPRKQLDKPNMVLAEWFDFVCGISTGVQFNEDQSTVLTGFAANNLAIVRHIVINLLRLNKSRKGSIKRKRMLAATSDQFRAELLGL